MRLHSNQFGRGSDVLLIIHGLLGSSDNWKTLATQWSDLFTVYTVDLRNHGASEHHDDINYDVMSNDIMEFIEDLNGQKLFLLGHSMGGKVAMVTALKMPDAINKLIVADIAPVKYDGGHEYIFKAMTDCPLNLFSKRSEVDEWMKSRIRNKAVRQFILKNLKRGKNGEFDWKVNIAALMRHYELLIDFPMTTAQFHQPTLFLKGGLSDYVNALDRPKYAQLFTDLSIQEIPEVGHWLHAEAPEAFSNAVISFLKD